MKKSDIQIGVEYAVHLGYGSATRNGFPDDLRRAEVIEFGWTEPMPKGETEYRWKRNHFGTRIKLLDPAKRNAYAWGDKAGKGSEHAVPNRAIFMPWDAYVLERDESKIYDEALAAVRRIDNRTGDEIRGAWSEYLHDLVLPEEGDGTAESFGGDDFAFGRPGAEDYLVLLRHVLMEGEESLTAVEKRIAELNAKAKAERRAAVEARNVKLAEIGAEVPELDEEVE